MPNDTVPTVPRTVSGRSVAPVVVVESVAGGGSEPAGAATGAAATVGLQRRAAASLRSLLDVVSAYLPLLLMGLLALGTWWLVKNTPQPDEARVEPAARHVPDYTMATFNVQRFATDGALRAQIEGDVLRHYPDDDTLEIDNPRILLIGPGGVTRATARLARSNADASQVQLIGGAHVVRQTRGSVSSAALPAIPVGAGVVAVPDVADTIEFRGEFLHSFQDTERLRSHLPVVVTRGSTQLRADTMDYGNLDRILNVGGRVRASFPSAPPRRVSVAR